MPSEISQTQKENYCITLLYVDPEKVGYIEVESRMVFTKWGKWGDVGQRV